MRLNKTGVSHPAAASDSGLQFDPCTMICLRGAGGLHGIWRRISQTSPDPDRIIDA
jgi:hypothetical protein